MAATTARRVRIAATASAVLLGGSLLGASTAEASMSAGTVAVPKKPYGIVTAHSGLNVRQYPSTDSSVKYVLPYGAKRGLDCKIRAQVIAGNPFWYKLRDSNYWISARYVHNVGHVKLCKDVHTSALNGTAKAEKAMG
ncbi:SH3 domain-containing protein [Streptomyces sp. HNM0575]|uniref:SH3 domain-containing protein n=1 Tax=Streptomyces sp. HNM0575 TaxID=2716338 RepID=UPI00145E409C|nr:SH3 domain-containing protein [Streptomyces sp. HNM0575]NLU71752.1 SH3 domain-containing protein [Streptomyces sp. HNM0575]